MRIVMNSQMAQIGIKTTPGQLTMHAEQPVVELETTPANLNLKATQPKVEIDQRQCFSESGLKSIFELIKENASTAAQLMYASIGRIVDQGNALTGIHNSGNVIAEQAISNAYDQFDKEFNMDTMPKSRPLINVQEGRIETNYQKAELKVTPRLVKPEISFERGNVEISMRQYNQLNISVQTSEFDQMG